MFCYRIYLKLLRLGQLVSYYSYYYLLSTLGFKFKILLYIILEFIIMQSSAK